MALPAPACRGGLAPASPAPGSGQATSLKGRCRAVKSVGCLSAPPTQCLLPERRQEVWDLSACPSAPTPTPTPTPSLQGNLTAPPPKAVKERGDLTTGPGRCRSRSSLGRPPSLRLGTSLATAGATVTALGGPVLTDACGPRAAERWPLPAPAALLPQVFATTTSGAWSRLSCPPGRPASPETLRADALELTDPYLFNS